jgi:hypothetical protein
LLADILSEDAQAAICKRAATLGWRRASERLGITAGVETDLTGTPTINTWKKAQA